mmetsp:Transcript_1848/g.4154  ORF Transcript_1848/g.4154 Transcript_1848/m.4154 type:complete len:364 (+) Transcript_1848:429-1520(+)
MPSPSASSSYVAASPPVAAILARMSTPLSIAMLDAVSYDVGMALMSSCVIGSGLRSSSGGGAYLSSSGLGIVSVSPRSATAMASASVMPRLSPMAMVCLRYSPATFCLARSSSRLRSSLAFSACSLRASTMPTARSRSRSTWSLSAARLASSSSSVAALAPAPSPALSNFLKSSTNLSPAALLMSSLSTIVLVSFSSMVSRLPNSPRTPFFSLPIPDAVCSTNRSLWNTPWAQPPKMNRRGPTKVAVCPTRPPMRLPATFTDSQRQSTMGSPATLSTCRSSRCRMPSQPPYTNTCPSLYVAVWPLRLLGGFPLGLGRYHVMLVRSSSARSPSGPALFWPPKMSSLRPGSSVAVWPARACTALP